MSDPKSTDPSAEEKDRVEELPTGAGEGDTGSTDEDDTASGGAPEEPAE